jgi:multisubunit Na+/H+ antiporter MnhB subunit
MPRGVPSDRALPRRVAIVAGLCAVTAIGLQARASLAGGASASAAAASGQVIYDVIGAADGAAFIASIVLLVLVFRARRQKREADPAGEDEETPLWVRALSVLLSLAAVGLPLWLIGYELRRKHAHGLSGLFGGGGLHHRHASAVPGSGWSVFTGMAIAAVALIVAGVIMLRHRAARDPLSALPSLDDQPAGLDDALSAGAAAIAEVDDPRAAIIACYAAMEQNLAGAGAAPAAADTPGEVLTRAATTGLIRSAAADQLTDLFRRARYGGRDMTETDRAVAQAALAQLRAELGSQSNGAAHRPELDGAR